MTPTKKQESEIKAMVDEGDPLSEAINVILPDLDGPEAKKVYDRIYRSMYRKRVKDGAEVNTRVTPEYRAIFDEIESAFEQDDNTILADIIRTSAHSKNTVAKVWHMRKNMLDCESFAEYVDNHYCGNKTCSRYQAASVWLAMYPEDSNDEALIDFVEGISFCGELPDLDDDEREQCRLSALHSSTLRTVDDQFNRRQAT